MQFQPQTTDVLITTGFATLNSLLLVDPTVPSTRAHTLGPHGPHIHTHFCIRYTTTEIPFAATFLPLPVVFASGTNQTSLQANIK